MEKQNPDQYYILVNQQLEIDSYSKNLCKIVDKKCLVPGISINAISNKSYNFITKTINEAGSNEKNQSQAFSD